ncbi:hypothetical protein H5200_09775 [Pseudoalteromonas sp. SG43-7]|uniref:Uncharacterized protein n=1 Tax=Pseudoalteromonas rhizosphaerae TaxID=2518973 RepID=A0ABW8KSC5_9GAMM|nr:MULTISPECIES: hypothetical protein [unclassified Pseudoalteromonas]MBB1331747.1 hypothetical protein [Pseudoalteromonas sp. SR41-6]MBB1416455.1 hypothetical protein [Pseudoalteromonas sp. SG44-1]MBB1422206.1 hypothetical protein [Pseudoalteromonas sp. SG43-7]MBB1433387.1 hypothetical protein [Pseudoalteromonas sp. SG43-6]MBB1458765.1 hypothetical protein [Pseudoalteromonas sp. SG41-8]
MKIKYITPILILLLIMVHPLNIYAKWHLKTFSGGFVYTLLNLTYVPYDYYRQIGEVWVDTDESRTEYLNLKHRYKGNYGVYIASEAVRNKNHTFSATMNCLDKAIELESSFSNLTDLNREKATSLLIGMYSVGDEFSSEIKCSISISEKTQGQFFVFVKKLIHY